MRLAIIIKIAEAKRRDLVSQLLVTIRYPMVEIRMGRVKARAGRMPPVRLKNLLLKRSEGTNFESKLKR